MKSILGKLVIKITPLQQLALISLLSLCLASPAWAGATVSVFATGFNNPRGLKFGPDGNLYVAEGGTGGLNVSTVGTQVAPPVGPYTANVTGSRISKVDPTGLRTTVIDNLPSSQTSPGSGGFAIGVADVAFIGNTLYALITGAGASHGVPSIPNGIIRVNTNGTYDLVANLSDYYATHPVQNPSTTDFEPDGVPYSMVVYNGDFYALEPNRGSLDRITVGGQITRLLDTSAIFGTVYVPTVLVQHGSGFLVGNLESFMGGGANVLQVDAQGNIQVLYGGFTDVLGIEIDQKGRIYVLETSTGGQGPALLTGDIVRIGTDGHRKVIASKLFFPTGMTLGPDGAMYVSNFGFGPSPNGLGQILRITNP